MNKVKVKRGFSQLSAKALDTFGGTVADKLAGNPVFAAFSSQTTHLAALITDFKVKTTAATSGDRIKIALRNEVQNAIVLQLDELALLLQASIITLNEEQATARVLAAGFEVVGKKAKASGNPETPTAPLVKHSKQSGELIVTYSPVKFADSYEVRYAEKDTEEWTIVQGKRPTVLADLSVGTYYCVQVRARGVNSLSDWSQITTRMCADGE
jgi:hypothetical protein